MVIDKRNGGLTRGRLSSHNSPANAFASASILGKMRLTMWASRFSSSLRVDRANVTLLSVIKLALFQQMLFDRFQTLAWLFDSQSHDETIVEIFPEFAIFLQVNQNRDLLALSSVTNRIPSMSDSCYSFIFT